jgi:hypothetical protein
VNHERSHVLVGTKGSSPGAAEESRPGPLEVWRGVVVPCGICGHSRESSIPSRMSLRAGAVPDHGPDVTVPLHTCRTPRTSDCHRTHSAQLNFAVAAAGGALRIPRPRPRRHGQPAGEAGWCPCKGRPGFKAPSWAPSDTGPCHRPAQHWPAVTVHLQVTGRSIGPSPSLRPPGPPSWPVTGPRDH